MLVNDDFNSIVAAIRQGRRVYANLKKAMQYLLIEHVPIAGKGVTPLLFESPLFFVPIHVVFMEFIVDPICAIALKPNPRKHAGTQAARGLAAHACVVLTPRVAFNTFEAVHRLWQTSLDNLVAGFAGAAQNRVV